LGAWLLRASGGFTGRANSVLPLGDPGLPIDEALVQVTDWYERRGLPTRFQVPLPLATELDNDLDERGWIGYNPTLVMVADIADVLLNTSSKPHLAPVTFAGTPDSAWLDTYSYRGQPLPPYAYEVMVKADDPVFAGVPDTGRDDGAYLAVSRGAITGHWLGVTAVDVEVRDRRRGLATHIMRALFEYSYARGVRHVYLQVAEENDAARALYGGLGFSLHHRYHYRIASIESKP
jgi:GNAT superfamily N-acetyltransferase